MIIEPRVNGAQKALTALDQLLISACSDADDATNLYVTVKTFFLSWSFAESSSEALKSVTRRIDRGAMTALLQKRQQDIADTVDKAPGSTQQCRRCHQQVSKARADSQTNETREAERYVRPQRRVPSGRKNPRHVSKPVATQYASMRSNALS